MNPDITLYVGVDDDGKYDVPLAFGDIKTIDELMRRCLEIGGETPMRVTLVLYKHEASIVWKPRP